MDGLTAIAELRRTGLDLPIVALSANASREDKQRCLDAGADSFVVKPVHVEELYAVLSRHLPEPQAAVPRQDDAPHPEVLRPEAINPKAIAGLDEELQQMIDSFVHRLPATVQEITTYYRQHQWRELAQSSHRLKGAGGAFGFPELSEISAQIMQRVGQSHEDVPTLAGVGGRELRELIDRLNQQCRQITKKAG
jgi:CheY-like chemotaxis protein